MKFYAFFEFLQDKGVRVGDLLQRAFPSLSRVDVDGHGVEDRVATPASGFGAQNDAAVRV